MWCLYIRIDGHPNPQLLYKKWWLNENADLVESYCIPTHTNVLFNGHCPYNPGLVGCLLNYQSPVILIMSIFKGQTKSIRTHRILWAVSRHLHYPPWQYPKGF